MMRIVLIILAFYTTALACIPCNDEVMADAFTSTITVIKTATDTQQCQDVDLCTPFCTCSCCASVSLQHQIASLPLQKSFPTFEDITFAYLSRSHSGDLKSIWQPPRA